MGEVGKKGHSYKADETFAEILCERRSLRGFVFNIFKVSRWAWISSPGDTGEVVRMRDELVESGKAGKSVAENS